MAIHTEKHLVALAFHGLWGHTRPLVQLTTRLVKIRPIYITLCTTNSFYDRVLDELARGFEPGEEAHAHRIRVLALGDNPGLTSEVIDKGFEHAYERLAAGKEVRCAKTGKILASLPPPHVAIIDFFASEPVATIRKTSGKSVKVYAWFPAMTSIVFTHIAPEELGGPGNIRSKAVKEAERTGKPFAEVVGELLFNPSGKIHSLPGLPPMSDYEFYPQDFPLPLEVAVQLFPPLYETFENCDGIFLISPASYEPEALDKVRAWLRETGRFAYVCGPLVQRGPAAKANETKQSQKGAEILQFLDTTLRTSGEKSLLYISFGSIFWPFKSPEKLWAFLDVVMELKIPFILSHASQFAGPVPDEVVDKVKAYGKGLLSPWSPQQTILEHPATGWFVTHGGHNSLVESVSAGVPMITWPFNADQPFNAVRISEVLGIGYELIEVRTGHGLHPLHRNGRKPVGTIDALKAEANDVLRKAFGDDGAQKREKVLALKQSFDQEWEEGGTAWKDIHAFLDSL